MAVVLKWHGAALLRYTEEAQAAGLIAASAELQRIARKKAGIPNIAKRHKRTRNTSAQGGGKKGSQYTTYPHSSKPGESPRRRTGRGQKGIVRRFDRRRMVASVGFTRGVRYMTFHELGIRYAGGLQQRPTLVPGLVDNLPRLSAIAIRAAKRVRARGGRR
jgi:hypothetical protein